MGAKNSKTKKNTKNPGDRDFKIVNIIDYISTKFITQAGFKELTNLHEKKYCDRLVIMTAKVIKHFLNDMEIKYMDQRTKKGAGGREVINKMAKKGCCIFRQK